MNIIEQSIVDKGFLKRNVNPDSVHRQLIFPRKSSNKVQVKFQNTEAELTPIPYWFERDYNDNPFAVWIKTSLKANTPKQIWIYSGSDAPNLSNGDDVFEFFDDFDGDSLNSEKWVGLKDYDVSGVHTTIIVSDSMVQFFHNSGGDNDFLESTFEGDNYIAKVKFINGDKGGGLVVGYNGLEGDNAQGYIAEHDLQSGTMAIKKITSATSSNVLASDSIIPFVGYNLIVTKRGGSITFETYLNPYTHKTISASDTSVTTNKLALLTSRGVNAIYSFIYVRKYSDANISVSYSEESSGNFFIRGNHYDKVRVVTLTSDKDVEDFQIKLDYNQINSQNLIIFDAPQSSVFKSSNGTISGRNIRTRKYPQKLLIDNSADSSPYYWNEKGQRVWVKIPSLPAGQSVTIPISKADAETDPIIWDGLMAWYKLNGDATDSSGNGYDGTIHGATPTTDRFGNSDKAMSFDGSDDYIDANPSLPVGNDARTISTWFKYTASQNSNWVSWGANSNNQLSQLGEYNSGIGYLGYGNDLTVDPTPYRDGEWHMMTVTFDGSTMILFIDGVAVNQKSTTLNTGSSALNIGRAITGSNYFEGGLDDVRIYNRALTDEEVWQLYTASTHNNGNNVFDFFKELNQEYSEGSVITNVGETTNYALHVYGSYGSSGEGRFDYGVESDSAVPIYLHTNGGSNVQTYDGSYHTLATSPSYPVQTVIKYSGDTTNIQRYVVGHESKSYTGKDYSIMISKGDLKVGSSGAYTWTVYIYWLFKRKLADQEPDVSITTTEDGWEATITNNGSENLINYQVALPIQVEEYQPLTINNEDTTLHDFQVEVNFNNSNFAYWDEIQDFKQIYFTDESGNEIPFTVLSSDVPNRTAKVLLKLDLPIGRTQVNINIQEPDNCVDKSVPEDQIYDVVKYFNDQLPDNTLPEGWDWNGLGKVSWGPDYLELSKSGGSFAEVIQSNPPYQNMIADIEAGIFGEGAIKNVAQIGFSQNFWEDSSGSLNPDKCELCFGNSNSEVFTLLNNNDSVLAGTEGLSQGDDANKYFNYFFKKTSNEGEVWGDNDKLNDTTVNNSSSNMKVHFRIYSPNVEDTSPDYNNYTLRVRSVKIRKSCDNDVSVQFSDVSVEDSYNDEMLLFYDERGKEHFHELGKFSKAIPVTVTNSGTEPLKSYVFEIHLDKDYVDLSFPTNKNDFAVVTEKFGRVPFWVDSADHNDAYIWVRSDLPVGDTKFYVLLKNDGEENFLEAGIYDIFEKGAVEDFAHDPTFYLPYEVHSTDYSQYRVSDGSQYYDLDYDHFPNTDYYSTYLHWTYQRYEYLQPHFESRNTSNDVRESKLIITLHKKLFLNADNFEIVVSQVHTSETVGDDLDANGYFKIFNDSNFVSVMSFNQDSVSGYTELSTSGVSHKYYPSCNGSSDCHGTSLIMSGRLYVKCVNDNTPKTDVLLLLDRGLYGNGCCSGMYSSRELTLSTTNAFSMGEGIQYMLRSNVPSPYVKRIFIHRYSENVSVSVGSLQEVTFSPPLEKKYETFRTSRPFQKVIFKSDNVNSLHVSNGEEEAWVSEGETYTFSKSSNTLIIQKPFLWDTNDTYLTLKYW